MKILLAGDTHGNIIHLRDVFFRAHVRECELIIQLGDWGYGWDFDRGVDRFSAAAAGLVEETGIPCWWLGGNHENYDALFSRVDVDDTSRYEYLPGVSYLPRGHAFNLDDVQFLVCGGAASVDKKYRKPGVSWWPQEMITSNDVVKCRDQGHADVLLTHDFPWECEVADRHLEPIWGPEAEQATTANRKQVSEILENCGATRVIHGHLHRFYSEIIKRSVQVTGLNCDGTLLEESTLVFDTEKFKQNRVGE